MSRLIKIFDTTLRDGEQSPGCSMNQVEKLEVARQLERLNVDVIEAGFAIASQGDFDSIQAIAKAIKTPVICSLSRAKKDDIKLAAESIAPAINKRIHTFIATSPIHMEYKLKMSPEAVIEQAVNAVLYAKSFVEDVEFSCEDAGRSEPSFLIKIITEVIKAGATTINIPDTVGYQTPEEFGSLIQLLSNEVIGIENVDISVHCHNDLGLATANSLAGVSNGATQIECTINGIGERAGNTALEEVVMALSTRSALYNLSTNINTQEIMKASRLVSGITGSIVQPNKAIVGANAFAHEAGIHQDGILKHRQTYEIMTASDIGLKTNALVLGKHSGRHAFVEKLNALGFTLTDTELNRAFKRFKTLADKKKELSDKDIEAIVSDEVYHDDDTYTLIHVQLVSGDQSKPTATIELETAGKRLMGSGVGAGSVDAIYKTIDTLIGEPIQLVDYTIQAVTGGTDALAEVVVRIKKSDRIFTGRGAALDVLVASAKAYISAINKQIVGDLKPRKKASL